MIRGEGRGGPDHPYKRWHHLWTGPNISVQLCSSVCNRPSKAGAGSQTASWFSYSLIHDLPPGSLNLSRACTKKAVKLSFYRLFPLWVSFQIHFNCTHFHNHIMFFHQIGPTGPIRSSSRDVRPLYVCTLPMRFSSSFSFIGFRTSQW